MRSVLMLIPAVVFAFGAYAKELACPEQPRPEGDLTWVSSYLVANGIPMAIQRFDGRNSVHAVLDFYRQKWGGKGADAPIEYQSGPWRVIAVARSGCFYTVQVQSKGGGSTGYIAASGAATAVANPPGRILPMLPGTQIASDIEHRDTGAKGRTIVASNKFSPEANVDFYRRRLGDEGWSMMNDALVPSVRGGRVIYLKRGENELHIVLTRQGNTSAIVANFTGEVE